MSKRKDGSVGPWAREKLATLHDYLSAYTTTLKNQTWCAGTIYVDAFAGPGRAPLRTKTPIVNQADALADTQRLVDYIKGSPRVALEIPTPFSRYVFVEQHTKRRAELQRLQAEFGVARNIAIAPGDANAVLAKRILNAGIDWRSHRAVVFLDPFGMQVPWNTLVALAGTGAIEVIISFPVGMAIQRVLTRSASITPGRRAKLDTYFGSSEWYDLVYETTHDLLGPRTDKVADAAGRLLYWYRQRLKAAFGHVSEAQLITNTKGGHLYYLIWAGPHPLGLQIANAVLTRGKRATAARQRHR